MSTDSSTDFCFYHAATVAECKKSRKLIENIGNIQTVPDSDSDTLN